MYVPTVIRILLLLYQTQLRQFSKYNVFRTLERGIWSSRYVHVLVLNGEIMDDAAFETAGCGIKPVLLGVIDFGSKIGTGTLIWVVEGLPDNGRDHVKESLPEVVCHGFNEFGLLRTMYSANPMDSIIATRGRRFRRVIIVEAASEIVFIGPALEGKPGLT